MDNSITSTIEKIKLQEQDKEAKLKEKREIDAAISSLNRAIRETTSQIEKSEQEQKTISNNNGLLGTQILLEKIRRDSLNTQLHALNKELEDLRAKSNKGISKVWEQRSLFCKEIHTASDNYDVWSLLIKPACVEPFIRSVKKEEDSNPMVDNEARIQVAVERRDKAVKERDRLKSEPDNGEEFLRIKNALRYSLEKIEELKKK